MTARHPGAGEDELSQVVGALTLAEQAGQLLLAAVPGTTLDDDTALLLRECHVSGVVLFGHNINSPEQVRALTAEIERVCGRPGLPALIVVDQEGGRVQRLKPPATSFPSAMAVGATGDPAHAHRWGLATARELRSLGINLNFAPVLDVNSDPRNPVIGTRSYGESAASVGRFGRAALAGLREGGVIATAKHFPGHGDTHVDSHFALPRITHDLARLRAVELAPFAAAIADGIPAVMTTHIVFPALDADNPATLSPAILTGLLREELGFDGAIVSDAMRMDAIANEFGIVAGCVAFIAAGGDLVEPLQDERAVHQALVAAVEAGRIGREQLAASARRVLRLRHWLAEQEVALGPADPAWLGAPEHRAWAAACAADAVTLLRDDAQLLPLPSDTPLAVIECIARASSPADGDERASRGPARALPAGAGPRHRRA